MHSTAACFIAGFFMISLAAAEAEIGIDDFLRDFYHTSAGRSEVKGSASGGTMPDGSRGMELQYDFTACPDAGNSFLRFHMDRVMPAKPVKVKMTLFNHAAETIPLTVFFSDAGGEVYLGRASAPAKGPHDLEIPIHPYPAWPSGDRNGKPDYPLTFHAILVDMPKTVRKNKLVIRSVSVVTRVDAESCMTMKLNSDLAFYGKTVVPFEAELRPLDPAAKGEIRFLVEFTDSYTGKKQTVIDRKFKANASISLKERLSLPFGSYQGQARLYSASGKLMEKKDLMLQTLSADCSRYPNDAFRRYAWRYGINGGVHGFLLPETAEKLGMNWIRFEWPNWSQIETAPGIYDRSAMTKALAPWKQHNVRPVLLQCLYHSPNFMNPKNLPEFSRGYGQYLKALFADPANFADSCELGNEDNGHNKFLYTEVARNGAAAVRSERPFAVISSTGTAFVDVNFLRFQNSRGLLDYLDALCVHPYTNNAAASQQVSPERFRTIGYLETLQELVFETGGMKELWVTEFGWPNGDTQQEHDRADLYVRQMLVCDAADLAINGLYTWDRDYGIVRRSAGAAVNRYAAVRLGTRFAGQKIEQGIYANLYLAPGRRTLAVWSPDDGTKSLPYRAERITDLFGNPVSAPRVGNSVLYLEEPEQSAVQAVASAGCDYAKKQFLKFYRKADQPEEFKLFAATGATDADALGKALTAWADACASSVTKEKQALIDFAWRWYLLADRSFGTSSVSGPAFHAERWREEIRKTHRSGVDQPALRHLLRLAEQLALEAEMSEGIDSSYAARCRRELTVLESLMRAFARHGRPFQFAVFTGLFQEHDGALSEKLRFIPGQQSVLRARVSNYGKNAVDASVRPLLPPNWNSEPAARKITVSANGAEWVTFTISCPPATAGAEAIRMETSANGSSAFAAFNDVELIPAVSASVRLLNGLPDTEPLRMTLSNREKQTVSGRIKLLPHPVGGGALTLAPIRIPAGGTQELNLKLSAAALKRLADAGYVFDLEFLLSDGRSFRQNAMNADFAAAVKCTSGIRADGDLKEWSRALPLKLNRASYTGGSYGAGWTPEDCSATTRLMYDEKNLYFAAVVRDQTFHQKQRDDSMWQQDSIQLVFAASGDAKEYVGLTLALSPDGPVIWHENARRRLTEASLAVKLGNEFIYEAVIPWSSLGGGLEHAVKRGSFRYGIAINDDDAIVPRRYLERFEGTIVHGKEIAKFARVNLLSSAPEAAQTTGTVFEEDFSAYPAGTVPAGYRIMRGGLMPENAITLTPGEKGRKILRLKNPKGLTANRFATMTGAVTLNPGKRYRLAATVRGRHEKALILGICSDLFGNKDYQYMKLPESMPDWKEYTLEFSAPQTGHCNVVIRCDGKIPGIDIAGIKITEL